MLGHRRIVNAVAWSIDGLLASCSNDSTDILWKQNQQLASAWRRSRATVSEVSACEIAPNGKTIVSAYWDKTLKRWDVASGTCQATL
jgi:WD40 repeat protein